VSVVVILFVFEEDGIVDTVVCARLEKDVDAVGYDEEYGGYAGDGEGLVVQLSKRFFSPGKASCGEAS